MKRTFKRMLSMLLSIVIAVTFLPTSAFSATVDSSVEFLEGAKENYDLLGQGFNALSNADLTQTSIINKAVVDYSKIEALKVSGGQTYSEAKYGSSVQEMMLACGIDYTNTASVSFPIKVVQVGFKNKFSLSADLSTKKTYESLYYQFTSKTVRGKYAMNLYGNQLGNVEVLSENFKNALDTLNSNINEANVKAFLNEWGTHILVGYEKGAYLEYAASAHTVSSDFKFNADLLNEMSASVGINKISVEAANSISGHIEASDKSKVVVSNSFWKAYGAESQLGTSLATDPEKNQATIAAWAATLNNENAVLLPESTKWVSIWELIPNSYAALKNAVQDYYKKQAETANKAFFAQFTTYGDVIGEDLVYYQSVTGMCLPVNYRDKLEVSQGSKFNAVNLNADLSKVRFSVSGPATIDEKYGIVTVNSNATNGSVITISVLDLSGTEKTKRIFLVQQEGSGFFAGGYGTSERPYLISTAAHFSNIRNYPDKHFLLLNDISLGSIAPIDSFSGTLDGNGYTLSGWSYTQSSVGNIGLICVNSGIVKNLVLTGFYMDSSDPTVHGTLNVGFVCGANFGTLENIKVNNSKIACVDVGDNEMEEDGFVHVGIICGYNVKNILKCVVTNCLINAYSRSDNESTHVYAGAIVGYSNRGNITDVSSWGNTILADVKAGDNGTADWRRTHKHGRPYAYVGGVVGYFRETNMVRALGYINGLSVKLSRPCGCKSDKGSAMGSIIGYRDTDVPGSWSACYSETADGNLIGNDSTTYNSANKLSSLNASNVINNLTGFGANGWVAGAGGHLEIAQNTSMVIDASQAKTEYFVGEPICLNGLVIKAIKNDAARTTTDVGRGVLSGYDANKVGKQTLTITYGKLKAQYTVTVKNPVISDIVISSEPYRTTYFKGETIDYSGLSVVAKKDDGSTVSVPSAQLSLPAAQPVTGNRAVTVAYQGLNASYNVEAFDVLPMKLEVVDGSVKKNYAVGDKFDPSGISVKLTYNNGDTEMLGLDDVTVDSSACSMNTTGSYSVKVKYENVETSYDIIVGSVKSISIATKPQKLSYYSSERKLDAEGLSINVLYDNGVTRTVSSGFTVSGYDNTAIGQQDITVTYAGTTTTYEVTVVAVAMVSAEISEYPKTTYYVGDTFTDSGLSLKIKYNDGSEKEVTEGFTVRLDGYDTGVYPTLLTLGTKNVLVTYSENGIRKTTEYTIEVLKDTITAIQIVQDPDRTVYNLWDKFSYAGMVVYKVYASGKAEPVVLSDEMFTVDTFETAGTQIVIMNCEGRSVEIPCTVYAPSSMVITKLPEKTEFEVGEEFSLEGLEVTSYFIDGTAKKVDLSVLEISEVSTETAGNKEITVTFGDTVMTFNVFIDGEAEYTVETYIMDTTGEYELLVEELKGETNSTAQAEYDVEDGFTLNEENSILSGTITSDDSLVLKVYLDRNVYTFTTVVDGVSTSEEYFYGSLVAEPVAPVKTGYTFMGWSEEVPSSMPANDVTLEAEWQVNTYTVIWIVDGAKTETYVEYGAQIESPEAPKKNGYKFIGWDKQIPDTMPANNLEFNAEFVNITSVSIKTPSISTVKYGDTLILHAQVSNLPDGAKLVWSASGSGISIRPSADGMTCSATSVNKGDTTITVKVVDKDGNVLKNASGAEVKAEQKLGSNAGFFQKLISFFKNLFGANRIIAQAFKNIF